ncbi:sugar diacid recognition domain-containing protein [Clostridium malenominatum]|uniref:Sugar diacid recognition domain-containing protein n=1 Tax=Clostridium malenominatum TaxID=1539 RepID=A0ABN1J352_9CLOT
MIELNSKLAQTIVEKMMTVIPYNINIMNSEGVIIGSGSKDRINTIHEGALRAIKEERMIEITKDEEYVKKGVNMPITYEGIIMGVIGISGEPSIVKPFGELVRTTAELLIAQENVASIERIKEKEREEYMFKWTYSSNDYTKEFIEKGKVFNIDILIKRRAVLIVKKKGIVSNDIFIKNLSINEYHINLEEERLLLFIKEERLTKYFNKLMEDVDLNEYYIGVSEENFNMGKAFSQSINAIESAVKLKLSNNIIYYETISYIFAILECKAPENMLTLGKRFYEEGMDGELIKTFTAYIEFSGEMNRVAKYLNIHRNTLNYRIEKIKNITGKDIKNYFDLIYLYLSYFLYSMKMECANEQ